MSEGFPATRGSTVCPVLVGREGPLALARQHWDRAGTGLGGMLFVAGEAGIGKTRLLGEVAHYVAATGGVAVVGSTFPRDSEVAGGALGELAAALRRCGRATAMAAGDQVMGVLAGGDRAGDEHRRRRMIVTELADALASAVGPEPLLLAIEDLHWADDLTLEVLGRLAPRLQAVPMLVVGTYRSDELFPRVPMREWRTRLLTQRQAAEVRLDRLSLADVTVMAEAIAATALPTSLVGAVFARSDGIPLHAEELLSAPYADELPDTLADAVLARATSLSPEARALAGAASVVGRSFDVDLLAAITGEAPSAIDAGLRELQDHFTIVARDQLDQPGTYDFRHALIRDTLYLDLAPLRRRELHRLAAAAAFTAGRSDAYLSDQYERAAQPRSAYLHALAGAEQATGLSAHREAVELLRRAQRTMPVEVPAPDRAVLLSRLAAALTATDDNAAAAAAYEEAYRMFRDLGDEAAAASLVPAWVAVRHLLGAALEDRVAALTKGLDRLGAAAAEDGARVVDARVRLLAGLSAAYMLDRRLEPALDYGQQARAMGASGAVLINTDVTVGSVLVFAGGTAEGWSLLEAATRQAIEDRMEAEAARGFRMLGTSASVVVEYPRALAWLRDGLAYSARTERWNDHHYMAAHLAHVQWATGDWEAAGRQAWQALADGGDGVTTRVTALHVLGYLAFGRGDTAAAEQHLAVALELGEQMNELQRLSPALWGQAEAARLAGDNEAAVRWCERGFAASAGAGDAAYLFPFLVTGVRAQLCRRDVTAAREWAARVEPLLRMRAIPGTLPAIEHARGLLHLADGHTGKARVALAAAAAAWRESDRFWEGTQALFDLAQCAQRSRRPAEAAALLADARARAGAAGALALSDGAPVAAPVVAEVLSAREVEVAQLVATGATNREIAAALRIAPKTVAAHIEHILAKLGAARRAEIAAWVTARPVSGLPAK